MTGRQTSQRMARILYLMEILIFAVPFYFTYGLLAVVSAPYAALLILFSPVWLMVYLADASGDGEAIILMGLIVTAIAALAITGSMALWKLARLSHVYLFKGAEELSKHGADFRTGLYCGLAPLAFTTTVMTTIVVSDGGWQDLPFAIIGGCTLLIPVTHLWVAMRRVRAKPVTGDAFAITS